MHRTCRSLTLTSRDDLNSVLAFSVAMKPLLITQRDFEVCYGLFYERDKLRRLDDEH